MRWKARKFQARAVGAPIQATARGSLRGIAGWRLARSSQALQAHAPTAKVMHGFRTAPPATTIIDGETWMILVTNLGAAKGRISWRPKDQEQLIIQAEWSTYKGERELAFSSARLDIPTDPRDTLHFVCSRATGIGPAMEALIWEHAGAAWQEIPENAVPRLSGRVYASFRLQLEALRDKSEEASTVAALMGKGATMNMACKAWEVWKLETLGVVNADPYRLAELDGYSFRDVDSKIRHGYGIADDDKRRIRAAVIYALRRITDAGDTVAGWQELYKQAIGLLGGFADLISECTRELFDEGTLKAFPASEGVSLAADWNAETAIWEFVEGKKQA